MTRYDYFDRPTQVKFWDVDDRYYCGGIAYCKEIICGCCGGIMDIDEINEDTPEGIEPIVPMTWIDISEEIMGDEC